MNSETSKEYCVNWKNHMSHVRQAFDDLLNTKELTDVTLCCEGKKIQAHKILLSACSTYFRETFKEVSCKHPVIILYGVEYSVLSDILHFIYNGEVSVDTTKLDAFLKMAQLLQINGLSDVPFGTGIKLETAETTRDPDETFIESVPAVTAFEETKKPHKRANTREAEPVREKVRRHEEETLFISEVKSEPSEIVVFDDPLEDPLQSDQSHDVKESFGNTGGHNSTDVEFKIEVETHRKFERFAEKNKPSKKLIPLNTLKSRTCIWSAFKNFCQERKYSLNQTTSIEEIIEILSDWGFNMKRTDGTDYKEGVVKTIWNTTAKMLQEMFYDKYNVKFDPFRDIDFKKARDSRDSKRRQLKTCPEKRKISATTLNELERLQIYSIWDENTPIGLQRKFYHVAAFELGWKGRDAAYCLTRYFRKEFDNSGMFTGRIEYDCMAERTMKDGSKSSKWLVADNDNTDVCPVRLLLKLLEKRTTNRNIKTDRLFLTPNPNWNKTETNAWYKDCPVGKNQIALWTKEAAERIGIDTKRIKVTNRSNCF